MRPYKALFEKYKEGNLSESRIEELNHTLVESYFLCATKLSKEELEYAEDMVIELYGNGKLEEKFAAQFTELLKTNRILSRKFHLLRNLNKANESVRMNQMSGLLALENAQSEQEEEAQLAKILHEVIEKIHSEKEATLVNSKFQIFLSQIIDFFKSLFSNLLPVQPQFRMAFAFATFVIIAGIVWVSVKPEDKKLISTNAGRDTIQKNQLIHEDSNQLKEIEVKPEINKPQYAYADSVSNQKLIKDQVAQIQKTVRVPDSVSRELDMALLAYASEIPAGMDYIELRSESSSANDLFIDAAEKYNNKDYNGCALILKDLLKSNQFKSVDTLSVINHYLGIISMNEGFNTTNRKSLKQAIQFYSKVDKSSTYFSDSQWYCALSEIKLGNKTKGIQILNSLPENNNQRAAELKLLKEKLTTNTYK